MCSGATRYLEAHDALGAEAYVDTTAVCMLDGVMTCSMTCCLTWGWKDICTNLCWALSMGMRRNLRRPVRWPAVRFPSR